MHLNDGLFIGEEQVLHFSHGQPHFNIYINVLFNKKKIDALF